MGLNNYYKTKKCNGFDSKFEYAKYVELDLMKKAGHIKSFETQIPLLLTAHDHVICTYIMDFVIYHHDGSMELLEVKGWGTEVWRLKWKMLEAMCANDTDIKLTVEFQGKGTVPKPKRLKKS